MTGTTDPQRTAAAWLHSFITPEAQSAPPFSLRIDGQPPALDDPGWQQTGEPGDPVAGATTHRVTWRHAALGLCLRAEVRSYQRFPAIEWVLHLSNEGAADSPLLEEVLPLDATWALAAHEPCSVRYSRGALCSAMDFEPLERGLRPKGELTLQPGGGRSSSEVLPFWNVVLGDHGVMLAVGWTGEWQTRFGRDADGSLRLRAGMAHTRFRLQPGESVRTPRILLLAWAGEPISGHNGLRRLILAHHRPRPGGQPLVAPLCNGNWGGTPAAVHLDNLRQIERHALPFEYYWIDAEWFGQAGHWMANAGWWDPRPDLYPAGLQPIGDAAARHGRRLLLWFEPERVAPGTPWANQLAPWLLSVPPERAVTWADYGDHLSTEEWCAMESARNQLGAGDRLLDLGHPEARRFLTDYLSERIATWGIGCLRWDSNIAQHAYWQAADEPEREGLTEIRYVEGQYALWDELLARHPELIIDNCASGGRRIDLESISRATPLWRTDYAVGHRDATVAQCHTLGLSMYVPINGIGAGYLRDCDDYILRSNMSASLVMGLHGQGDAAQPAIPEDYPFEHARRLLTQYLTVRRYYYGEFYPLTAYTRADDAWCAYQLHLPESDEGLLVVLKRPRSPFEQATFQLQALAPMGEYEFHDWDAGRRWTAGAPVSSRVTVNLTRQPDSALISYQRRR